MRRSFGYVWVVFLASALAAAAEPEVRPTPLSPEDELATFKLADERLTVDLVAREPEVDSPVAICWDGDARMYVAEMVDYPTGPPAGRVRLLEDRDNDGVYEQATTFAGGLNFPNGVLAALGGVFVTAAPDLLFLKDTDGDGVADQRTVVFTGFGEGNQQLRANGLTWGLDNWIHGANGRSDGNVRRPGDPPEKAVSIRGRDFRFTLDGRHFESVIGQSQFGQTSDDWGNRFLSWNTIPIRHALFDQAFADRNPRLALAAVRDIADPADTGQVFPISPRPQTFNRERTDFYNALAGLTIYRGDALGRDYNDSAFAGESLTNLVHRRALMPAGPTYVSRRGEHDREFLAAADPWFHPVFMTTGPDGALYVVDFYRRWVEHPAFVAESIRGDVDWREGAGHGRICDVSRRENTWPPRPQPRLMRRHGRPGGPARIHERLAARHGPSAAGGAARSAGRAPLRALLTDSRLPQAKVHALSILDAQGELNDSLLVRGLEAGEAHVRQFALRLAAPRIAGSASLRESMLAMTDFPSPLVRFQLALALAGVEGPEKVASLVKLADRECGDPVISAAVVGSLGTSAGPFLAELVKVRSEWRGNPSEAQMYVLREAAAAVVGGGNSDQLRATFLLISPEKADDVTPGDLAMLNGLAQALTARGHCAAGDDRRSARGFAAVRAGAQEADRGGPGDRRGGGRIARPSAGSGGSIGAARLGRRRSVAGPRPAAASAGVAIGGGRGTGPGRRGDGRPHVRALERHDDRHPPGAGRRRLAFARHHRGAGRGGGAGADLAARAGPGSPRRAVGGARSGAAAAHQEAVAIGRVGAQPRRGRGPLHRVAGDGRRPDARRGLVRETLPGLPHRADAWKTGRAGPVGRRRRRASRCWSTCSIPAGKWRRNTWPTRC